MKLIGYVNFISNDFRQYKGEQRIDKNSQNLVDYEAGLTIFNTAGDLTNKKSIQTEIQFLDNPRTNNLNFSVPLSLSVFFFGILIDSVHQGEFSFPTRSLSSAALTTFWSLHFKSGKWGFVLFVGEDIAFINSFSAASISPRRLILHPLAEPSGIFSTAFLQCRDLSCSRSNGFYLIYKITKRFLRLLRIF